MAQKYDTVVIGAGTGGYVAAIRAAQLGQRVAVVERQPALGGTCLLWGCNPTKAEAKSRGYDVRVGTFPFGVLARAKVAGETEGFVKIVADRKYDEVLGVHMIGPRSTELVAEAVRALRLECTVEELVKTIHAHPTFSEAVGEASHAAHGAAIHL